MRRIRFSTVMLVPLAMLLVSCGSSSKSSTPTSAVPTQTSAERSTTAPAPTSSGPAITIENGGTGFRFSTSPVKAGATVTVKNNTSAQHTVTADTTAGGFDLTIDPGKTVTFTAPATPGAYKFHCNIHNYMMSTLTVT